MINRYGMELMISILQLSGESDPETKAQHLYTIFGGFSAVADAKATLLMSEGKLSENTAVLLKLFPELVRRKLCAVHKMPRRISDPALYDALQAKYFGFTREFLTVIGADRNDRILGCLELEQDRTESVSFNVTKVLEFAWSIKAAKLVLAHNHPDGFAVPSLTDAVTQRTISEIVRKADIEICDHIIIADDGCVSMQI